ncbi:MAG: U3 snoRNP protein [Vezdaea acicularis]|nr:MAG: U3 snoRNP protein [Vezdaea acicularis]
MDEPISTQPDFIFALSSKPDAFLQRTTTLHDSALELTKRFLDPLASAVSETQSQRLKSSRRKRKRGGEVKNATADILQLKKLYLEGFAIEQVWEQARRILDASRKEVERNVPTNSNEVDFSGAITGTLVNSKEKGPEPVKRVRFDEDGFGFSDSGSDDGGAVDGYHTTSGDESDVFSKDGDLERAEEEDDGDENSNEGVPINDLMEEDKEDDESEDEEAPATYTEDPNGLNDGFFSIDDFNQQTEFLERQDAAGDTFDGQASDEEEIDWDADLTSIGQTATGANTGKIDKGDDMELDNDESEESNDDGPIFRNSNLDIPSEDDAESIDGSMDDVTTQGVFSGMANTNDVRYKEFFAPPARKAGKGKRNIHRSRGPADLEPLDEATQIERTMSAVRRDLFEDDLSANEDDGSDLSEKDAGDPKGRRSNHERRQAKLAAEIRRLEAENIAKRDWTLSGEARAADRPLNSLLEEDLDFERTGKPVPVITAETSEEIEEMIKRRILAQEFDEVIRRRPDEVYNISAVRRGRIELEDTKAQQSLAEQYEEDLLRKRNPESYTSITDEKLKKEHQELERMWKDICAKLDGLSNWHYKPKPPKPSITIIADVPTIAMEDARPVAAGVGAELGAGSMLAPQEIYKPGTEKANGSQEVMPKSGMPVAKAEMTRDEKVRKRRREKERLRKSLGNNGPAPISKGGAKAKEKRDVISDLKKGGVKVIGKKGQLTDVEGKQIKQKNAPKGAGAFKL